jgi:hypothetical protein
MSEAPVTGWFAGIYAQAVPTVAMLLAQLRKDGREIADFVVVVAVTTDESSRFFVDQLGDGPLDAGVPGFVGAIPKERVARALRLLGAEAFAEGTEKPLEDGFMRVLVAARGNINCADIPALPAMAPGGSA